MGFKRVAIIGTDCISVSIALGLKAQKEPPEIIGHHDKTVAADLVRARGAFDQVKRRPGQACQGADLVIVSVPFLAIRETFTAIAPHLQSGTLVTDTAHLKGPVIRWAEELLPRNVFFVGGHLVPNPAIAGLEPLEGLEAASADLLKEALYCLTMPIGAAGAVIDSFVELTRTLGAQPFFIDATEHDGLHAGIEGLPDLLAFALLRATVNTPGWQEMRKFAGHRFAAATSAADDVHERGTAIFLNRENVLLRLNTLLNALVHMRDLLAQDNAEPFEEMLMTTAEGRVRWIEEREQGMWVKERAVSTEDVPTAGEQFSQMIFGERLGRRREEADRSRKK